MTENKTPETNQIPEPGAPKEKGAIAACDPGKTQLLPAPAVQEKQDASHGPVTDSAASKNVVETLKPLLPPRFKPLSQAQIIWISLSFILVFLLVFFWLIMQKQHKNKTLKQAAIEQIEDVDENAGAGARDLLKTRMARQVSGPEQILTDDEFAGQAPMTVKASGPVVSAAIDPELAAMVDALKKRLLVSVDSKSTSSGNIVTRVSRGEFRGFKIAVDERLQNQVRISEEVAVTFPKKGFIKTVNHILDSFRDSDREQFVSELRNAGLETVKLPAQPANEVCQVQLKSVGFFGKPLTADMLISGKNVGKLSLGMSTARLESILLTSHVVLKRKVLVNDTYRDVYKVLDQSNEPLFFVYENNGLVWGISIISDIYKTEKGIGIGSNLGDMRINYPKVNVALSDKNTPFVKIDGIDGLFIIENDKIDIPKRIFPNKTKIISILIGKSLEFE